MPRPRNQGPPPVHLPASAPPAQPAGDRTRYLPYMLFTVLGLILAMAAVSRFNSHPDETAHVRAAEYYLNHWLPPAAGAAGTEGTYSVYGSSRLNDMEIAYWAAGKFGRLLTPLDLPPHLAFRLFNVALFLLLTFLLVRRSGFRIAGLVLILTPQLWYVFSYFNSDAFAFFVAFLVTYQLCAPQSMFQRIVLGGEKGHWLWVVVLGMLLGLVPLVKQTFWVLVPFWAGYWLWRVLALEKNAPRIMPKALAWILFTALLTCGAAYGLDHYRNGWDKAAKKAACRERFAERPYRPGTPLDQTYFGLQLRAKGIGLAKMLGDLRWGKISFRSFFGVYGYLALHGPGLYYRLMLLAGLGFLAYLLYLVIRPPDRGLALLLILFLGASLALVGVSAWHSWVNDYQPQGRYLLPILIMLGVFLLQAAPRMHRWVPPAVAGLFLGLGLYSFVLVGLVHIQKG